MMISKLLKTILVVALFAFAGSLSAQSVLGKWKTFDDETGDAKSIVQITEKDGKIYGKILELLNPDKKSIKCEKCPGDDKGKPVEGIVILKGLSKKGDEYTNGQILDPASGKLYKCTVALNGADELKVRGYVGFSLLGRTQKWTRVK